MFFVILHNIVIFFLPLQDYVWICPVFLLRKLFLFSDWGYREMEFGSAKNHLSGQGSCLQFQKWNVATGNSQIKLSREARQIFKLRVWLRDSMNKMEAPWRMTLTMGNHRHMSHTYQNMHIHTCYYAHTEDAKRKLYLIWWNLYWIMGYKF